MANPNPSKARAAKKAKRMKPGDLSDAKDLFWRTLMRLKDQLDTVCEGETDTAELTKLSHAIGQLGSTYMKCIEVGELEARLQDLEDALERKAA